jgi:hypothetical protein
MRLAERSNREQFAKTLPPGNRLSEEQEDALIDSMYKGRQGIYSENPDDITSTSDSQKEISQRSLKMTRLTNQNTEAARSILSPEHMNNIKSYLQKKIEIRIIDENQRLSDVNKAHLLALCGEPCQAFI